MPTTTATCGRCHQEAQSSPTMVDNGQPICDACIDDPGTLALVDRLRATARDARNDPRVRDAPQQWLAGMLHFYVSAVPMPAEPDDKWWDRFHRYCAKADPTGWALFLAICAEESQQTET